MTSHSAISKVGQTMIAFANAVLYLLATGFFFFGLISLSQDPDMDTALLCFVVGLLICLLISLGTIRRTLQGLAGRQSPPQKE